jgi:protocatechuate 3,4-dioxygenase beta subunit
VDLSGDLPGEAGRRGEGRARPAHLPADRERVAGKTVFATTDDKGEARFPKPADVPSRVTAQVFARDAAGHGGFGLLFGEDQRHPPTVELLDNAELTGRVTDAAGKPVRGLRLRPVALGPENVAQHAVNFARHGPRALVYADPPDWFWAAFPPKVAADGKFTLPGVPTGYSVAVQFEAAGFGSGRFWVAPGKPAVVGLQRAGAIRLRFNAPADARPGDIRVTATHTARPDLLEVTASGTARAGADLTLPDLPPGEYRIAFPLTTPATVFPKSVGTVTVKPGATTTVTIPLEPAARITAHLIDSKTGKGVAGGKLTATTTRGPGDSITVADAKADAQGKVELLVPAGMVQVVPGAAEGYAVVPFSTVPFHSDRTEGVPVAPGKAHDFGAFALVRTVDLAGLVVDEANRPVAGASVEVGYTGTNFYRGKAIASGADGRFVIRGMSPERGVFGVTARKGNAITAAPVAADPAKPDGALRILVSEKFAARVRARAVDRAGKPVAAAGVELYHSVTYLARDGVGMVVGSGYGRKVATTPDDGRFESDLLQPGDRYRLILSAPGYRSVSTPEWVAVPGEIHDFGDLVLTRADLAGAGTVIDPAGKPVAGATVFDNADGPAPVTTTTDAAGRFVLDRLYEGPAFVSVRAARFRLANVPAEPGGPAVAVKLRPLTDLPAPPPVVSAAHRVATAKLTRRLLETMWANRVAANDDGKLVLRGMAHLDVATARKWRGEEKVRTGGRADLTVEIEAAERDGILLPTARDDPDEAVALLKPVRGVEGFLAVCRLARDLLPDAPDKALRVAEEAVVRARGMPGADRPWALAQAGELVFRAGKKDAGRKLIEEAAKLVEPLGFDELDGYRRGMVGCRVALYDPASRATGFD